MGVVFSAWDDTLKRLVALKLVRADRSIPDARLRLEREAQALAKVQHPHVVTVYDVGEANGELFIAMELIDGKPLSAWAAGRKWREVLEVLLDAGRGLAEAHDAGVLHRDFKPGNVLVDFAGRARVADFGLAAASKGVVQSNELSASLTEPGAPIGTPGYMAPELAAGGAASEASDVYSFCRTLERLIAPLPGAPEWLGPIIRRGLEEEPGARWGRMASLLLAIDHELRVDPAHDPRPASAQRTWFFALLAVVTLSVPVFLVGGMYPLVTTLDAVRLAATVVGALTVGLGLFWPRIKSSPYTRRGATALVAISSGMLVHRVVMLGFSVELSAILAVDLLVFASFSCAMGIFWARRYLWLAGLCLAGSVGIALAPHLAMPLFGATTLAMLPLGFRFWVRGTAKP
jgi:serine/threonine-protein kinase